ncbi:MAG: class I SAM-dependent methyltransferase [Acidobacteria bacterium]|nr:class I SAM-dependent methyltransferase [Acidobacteriota bacterium]MBI3658602.1 class I SAM-dependent methyltransferase [Acidobacteriota bacterium]
MNEDRIAEAGRSLKTMLGIETLAGKSFLDIGSGSGLFSLAAMRLGATRVHSFDYDPQSVACVLELKHRYFHQRAEWTIEQGSVLDTDYLRSLGTFDIVYSWGVLHHTGAMWQALENVLLPLAKGGTLFIAIYNYQYGLSAYWTRIKRLYNRSALTRLAILCFHWPYLFGLRFVVRALKGAWHYERGMSLWHDMIDWLGGYPFEVAKPEAVFDFYHLRGLTLLRQKTCGGRHGCNEYVIRKPA